MLEILEKQNKVLLKVEFLKIHDLILKLIKKA